LVSFLLVDPAVGGATVEDPDVDVPWESLPEPASVFVSDHVAAKGGLAVFGKRIIVPSLFLIVDERVMSGWTGVTDWHIDVEGSNVDVNRTFVRWRRLLNPLNKDSDPRASCRCLSAVGKAGLLSLCQQD
jgi:hypothetical protein